MVTKARNLSLNLSLVFKKYLHFLTFINSVCLVPPFPWMERLVRFHRRSRFLMNAVKLQNSAADLISKCQRHGHGGPTALLVHLREFFFCCLCQVKQSGMSYNVWLDSFQNISPAWNLCWVLYFPDVNYLSELSVFLTQLWSHSLAFAGSTPGLLARQ